MILAIVLFLIVLGLLGVNVEHDVAQNQNVQDNVSYVSAGVTTFWENYLSGPAHYLWQDVFLNIIWKTFIVNMQRLQDGQTPTDFYSVDTSSVPTVRDVINGFNYNHP